MAAPELTKDYFYKNRVVVYQKKKGFRFSVDAPILADFIPEMPGKRAYEIGSGSGIISMLLTCRNKVKHIHAFEIQPVLAEIARKNIRENRFEERIEIIEGDFISEAERIAKETGQKPELIFSNPPYYTKTWGRISQNPEIATAKFELTIRLSLIVEKAASLLIPGGDLCLILPWQRHGEMMDLASEFGFKIRRKRLVRTLEAGKNERFLIQLTNQPDRSISPEIEPPLVIYREKAVYSDEMTYIIGAKDRT